MYIKNVDNENFFILMRKANFTTSSIFWDKKLPNYQKTHEMTYNRIIFLLSALILVTFIFFPSCKPEDTTPPVLTLNGGSPYKQSLPLIAGHGTWSDPGFVATDNKDGNMTSKVNVFGTVNPNAKGSYTLTYSVKDAAGNVTTVNRAVNIVNDVDSIGGAYSVSDTVIALPIPYTVLTYSETIVTDSYTDRLVHFSLFGNYSSDTTITATITGTSLVLPHQKAVNINGTQTHIFTGSSNLNYVALPVQFTLIYTDKDSTVTPGTTTIHHAFFNHQ
jgi:hypothetical protein